VLVVIGVVIGILAADDMPPPQAMPPQAPPVPVGGPQHAPFVNRPGQKGSNEAAPIQLKGKQTTVNGRLTDADAVALFRGGAYCKVYTYQMTAGRTYTIELESQHFDAYLRLEDPQKALLVDDDDSGGDLNARVVYVAEKTGMHRIIVTSCDPGQLGDYVLRISVAK
jgi:serine protease Do